MKVSQSKTDKDPFFGLKFIAYARISEIPDIPTTASDLVSKAKMFLCQKRNVLFFDPVWDRYKEEEILVEYYTILMLEDDKFRMDFKAKIKGVKGDDIDWVLRRAKEANEKSQSELKAKEINFSPDNLGEEEEI
jgi:hypothetical protein